MRKPGISVFLVLTLLFSVFTLGFFLGRNQNRTPISVSVPERLVTAPSLYQETTATIAEQTEAISFPICINRANKKEFMALPGIGEVLAERIVDYREKNGLFSDPEELLNVEGIGKKRLEEIWELITVGG